MPEVGGWWSEPVAVGEWSLDEPIVPRRLDTTAQHARLLLRHRGRPVEWIVVPLQQGWVTREALEAAIAGAGMLPAALLRAALEPVPSTRQAGPVPASVIVCTRDRAEGLARCLQSLQAMHRPAAEIIVVDNASRDDATRRAAEAAGVRYVREERPGLDWARNAGLAAATQDLVAYTDDDVRVDAGWLEHLVAPFANPRVALTTGLVLPASLETEAERLFEFAYGGMGKGFTHAMLDPATCRPDQLVAVHHLGLGASMAYRTALLRDLGGFDTALDVGTPSHGAGDLDMFHRVLSSGACAHYTPEAIAWHAHRTTTAALHRQLYDNGRAFGVYLITRWNGSTVPRRVVARYAGAWLRWLLGRIPRRLLRRPQPMPLPFVLSEARGMVSAPLAYVLTRRHDYRVRTRAADSRPGLPDTSRLGTIGEQ